MKFRIIILWAIIVGFIGFGAGFVGPIIFNPSANQGPLFGLFFSGPISFLVGAILGVIVSTQEVSRRQNYYLLGVTSFVILTITLYFSLPEARYLGFIVDGELRNCKKSNEFIPARIDWWSTSNRKTKWRQPRPEWENDTERMLAMDKGVVLQLYVYRKRELFESQKPWNKGTIRGTSWHVANKVEDYYARFDGNSCDTYEVGKRSMFFPKWEVSKVSPPDILPTFLGLYVLNSIPNEYAEFIKE